MDLLQSCKALADATRLRIVRVLLGGPLSVNELVEILDMGQSRVSRHLKLLLDSELLQVRREGTWAYYESNRAGEDTMIGHLLELIAEHGADPAFTEQDEARRLGVLERRRQRSRSFHDRVAPHWSRLRQELLGDGEAERRMLELLDGAQVVADLGCGAGELLPELARRAHRVIGVDSSDLMLEQARRRLEQIHAVDSAGAARIELRLGSLEHLPLADGEADAAVLNMVLHHLADPPAVLRDVRRSLRPGGRLVICDLARHDEEWMRDSYGDQWLGFSEHELSQFLQQAGYVDARLERHEDSPRAGAIVAAATTAPTGEPRATRRRR